jgi:uncharacterized protein GlcG (DUF336 family)
MPITLDVARRVLDAAVAEAERIDSPSSIAIVDDGRNLVAFMRMDGALLASIEISIAKAYTARSMNMSTGDITPLVQPGQPLYGLETTHRQPLVVIGGGFPLSGRDGIVGAIGVAGGSVEQDEQIALAGQKAT